MSMSKRDYQAIARAIYPVLRVAHDQARTVPQVNIAIAAIRNVVENIADVMAEDNPAFDRARFLEACETGTTRGMRKVS